MNRIAYFFSRYIRSVFFGKIESNQRIVDIDEVDLEPSTQSPLPSSENFLEKQAKIKLIVQINRLLMVVCALSFIFILFYTLKYPNKSVPDLIQNAFFTTLGWFGGVLGAFFQVNQTRNS